MHKRIFLKWLAAASVSPLAACEVFEPHAIEPVLSTKSAVFVPGYSPAGAVLENEPADSRRRRSARGPQTLLTRVGMDGTVRQAVFPVIGHDVAIAPDGRTGFMGRMNLGGGAEAAHHVIFDAETLEMIADGRPIAADWRGGGHGLYLPDGTLLCSERAPLVGYDGNPRAHDGRISVRDPQSLKVLSSFSCHGIDPHEIRLTRDGRHLAVANYGSTAASGAAKKSAPRHMVEASVTIIEIGSGRLVERATVTDPGTELRHVALGADDRSFAIRCRLGRPGEDATLRRRINASEPDRTADPDSSYLPAAPVMFAPDSTEPVRLASREAPAHLRHGLSVEYDPLNDEFIASFPSSHRLMVFSASDGHVKRSIDTRQIGLDYPCGLALLGEGPFYALAGYWQDLLVMRRGTHRPERRLSQHVTFYGHSHMTAA